MLLEAAAGRGDEYQPLPLQPAADTVWQCDWQPLLPRLMDESLSVAERAALFHQSLAQSLLQQALKAREAHGVTTVGLAGGVFQNRTLSESVLSLLQQSGFTVRLAQQLPCNDGGLAWGQLIESAPQLLDGHSPGSGKL
jgi:hydrogenase maturation protein HypF